MKIFKIEISEERFRHSDVTEGSSVSGRGLVATVATSLFLDFLMMGILSPKPLPRSDPCELSLTVCRSDDGDHGDSK